MKDTDYDLVHTDPGTPGGLEDYVTQVGQGHIADRDHEHLGRNDTKIILRRKILQREVRALAEGRPTKQWTSSDLYE